MSRKRTKLFIQIHHELYDSATWKGMHWYSKLAYLRIKRKYNPRMGEEITVSYEEMKDEMAKTTFAKAIRELEKRGFIKIESKGGLYRRRNYYTLSNEWRWYGGENVVPMVDIHNGKRGLLEDSKEKSSTSKRDLPSNNLTVNSISRDGK